mgnify:CR=1 FL=1
MRLGEYRKTEGAGGLSAFLACVNAPGAVLPGSLHLDVHGQVSVLPERVVHKDNPADFVGDYRASGTMLGLGTTLSAVF